MVPPVLAPVNESETNTSKTYYIKEEKPNGGKLYNLAKRLFDFSVSAICLLVLAFPMLIIAVVIHCDSKGGVIFRQERLGKDSKSFTMYKFRTMYDDAEANGPQWAEQNDDRCTRVGAFLRACRLDELPQLFNILKGDMSFVGPRPERPYFYARFETYIHGFSHRLAVTPGLTGLAQINGGYDLSPEEKIVYDMEYIRTRTFWMDIKLIFKTVKLIFTHEGAR